MLGLFLLKPETLNNPEIEAEIISMIKNNFEILDEKLIQFNEEMFIAHQPSLKDDFIKGDLGVLSIFEYLKMGNSKAILIKGEHTFKKSLEIKQKIRDKYIDKSLIKRDESNHIIKYPPNFIHSSTDVEELKKDIQNFFPEWTFRFKVLMENNPNIEKENATLQKNGYSRYK